MKYILSMLMMTMSLVSFTQINGIRVYFERENTFYKQTIVLFSPTSTDGYDIGADGIPLGTNPNSIYTTINGNNYSFNSFANLIEDKTVPLILNSAYNSGTYTLGIDEIYGDTLPVGLIDSESPGYKTFPYQFEGPIADGRFSLRFEKPMNVIVNNDCELGFVVIDNDLPTVGYSLFRDNNIMYLPHTTDTIYDLPSGDYHLCLYDSIPESVYFTINNTVIDAVLFVPYTLLHIEDSYVLPILNIYSPYTSVLWDFGDGTTLWNDLNPVHHYTQVGTYNLSATVNENNCSKQFQTTITVESINGIQQLDRSSINRLSGNYYNIDGKLVSKQTEN